MTGYRARCHGSQSVSSGFHEFEQEAISIAAKPLCKNALGMVIRRVGQDIGIALDHEAGCFGCFNRQRFFDSVQRCIISPGYPDVIDDAKYATWLQERVNRL